MFWKTVMLWAFVCCYTNISSQVLSLEDCYQKSLDHSYLIKISDAEIFISEIDVNNSWLSYLPTLNIGSNLYTSGNAVDPTNNSFATDRFLGQSMYLSSDLTLWDWGKRKIDIEISKLGSQSFIEQKSIEERSIKLNVLKSFTQIKVLENTLNVLQSEIKLSDIQLEAVLAYINEGSKSKKDLLQIELQKSNEELRIIETEVFLEKEKLALKRLIGLNEETILQLENIDFISTHNPPSLNLFLANHPELIKQNQEKEVLNQVNRKESRSLFPDLRLSISLGSNYSSRGKIVNGFTSEITYQEYLLNGETISLGRELISPLTSSQSYGNQLSGNINYSLSMGFYYPIFDRGSSRMKIQKSKIRIEQKENEILEIIDDLTLMYKNSLIEIENQDLLLKKFEEVINKEEHLFKLASEELELGSISAHEWRIMKSDLQMRKMELLKYRAQSFFLKESLKFL